MKKFSKGSMVLWFMAALLLIAALGGNNLLNSFIQIVIALGLGVGGFLLHRKKMLKQDVALTAKKDTELKIDNVSNPSEKEIKVPSTIKGFPLAYRYDSVKVAVLRGQEPDFSVVELGALVEFVQEPTNEYDNRAIMVISNGVKLGYVFRGKLQDMINDFINKELPIFSCVVVVNASENEIRLFIAFYKHDGGETPLLIDIPEFDGR